MPSPLVNFWYPQATGGLVEDAQDTTRSFLPLDPLRHALIEALGIKERMLDRLPRPDGHWGQATEKETSSPYIPTEIPSMLWMRRPLLRVTSSLDAGH